MGKPTKVGYLVLIFHCSLVIQIDFSDCFVSYILSFKCLLGLCACMCFYISMCVCVWMSVSFCAWSIPWRTVCCSTEACSWVMLYRAGLFRPSTPGVLFSLAFVTLNSLFPSFRHNETEALFHSRCLCTHKEMRQLWACWGLARIDNPQVY